MNKSRIQNYRFQPQKTCRKQAEHALYSDRLSSVGVLFKNFLHPITISPLLRRTKSQSPYSFRIDQGQEKCCLHETEGNRPLPSTGWFWWISETFIGKAPFQGQFPSQRASFRDILQTCHIVLIVTFVNQKKLFPIPKLIIAIVMNTFQSSCMIFLHLLG